MNDSMIIKCQEEMDAALIALYILKNNNNCKINVNFDSSKNIYENVSLFLFFG